ncbi:MAG: DUF2087 domain-containing protein [Pseudomonadota bacterium]
MARSPLPLQAADLTDFTRKLSSQLGATAPSHLTLMNMIARAAGFENVQHLRAAHAAVRRRDGAQPPEPMDARLLGRALRQFAPDGRLAQWPSKQNVQKLALWVLWAALPAETSLTERAISERLNQLHSFEDAATLRRLMISNGLLTRTKDGAEYRRIEQKPPAEAVALMRDIKARRKTGAAV